MLHSQTTLILAALLFLVLPLMMWWITAGQRSPAMRWWVLGSLTMGAGIVLMGVRPWVPPWLSYHVANACLLIAMFFWAQSLRVMHERGWSAGAVLIVVVLSLFYYSVLFSSVEPHVRGMAMRGTLGVLALYTSWQGWKLGQRLHSHNATAIAVSYLLLGLGLLVQVVQVGVNKDPNPFSNTWDASVIALLTLATSAVGHFCFTGMVLDASAREQVRAVKNRREAEETARLETKLRLMDRHDRMLLVSGSMTRELSQPLKSALSEAQRVRDQAASDQPSTPSMAEGLERIAAHMRQASATVDRIRASARTHGVMRLERLDLRDVLQATSSLMRASWRERNVQVEIDLDREPLWCNGDEVALSQLLVNLLRNATQAQKNSPRWLQAKAIGTDTEVMVVIRDLGPGFPAEVLAQWEATFVSTHEATLGLGLMISRTIAQQHHGRMSLRNHPSGGAEAVVALPRAWKDRP